MGTKKTPGDEPQVDADVRPESEQPAPEANTALAVVEGEPPAEAPAAPATAPTEAPAPAAEAPPAKPPEQLTPAAWAAKLGHARKASPLLVSTKDSREPKPGPARFSPQHAAADQLHGWSAHKQHTADELVITRKAYEAALAAALTPVAPTDEDGKPTGAPKYRPHAAALSPFCPRGNAQ
jgi:pyruvate dehydrogenase E2 component (dihydrolipoamide acetyltransferase)